MASTFSYYAGFSYGVPFGMFALLFFIMSIINKRAHAFIVETVLGIKLKSIQSTDEDSRQTVSDSKLNKNKTTKIPQQQSSDNGRKIWSLEQHVDTFLYIEEKPEAKEQLPCIVRFLCDIFSSAILSVLLEIIFEKCVLAYASIIIGDPCPDFNAECFGTSNGISNNGPFQCISGQNASFPVTSSHVNCYGWIYKDVTTDQVLDAIGVSGGLLGIVSCIVPLVYHLSYFKNRCWGISIFCAILPLLPIAAFILLIIWESPEVVSVVTIIAFSLVITMTCGGWIWAVYSSSPGCCFDASSCYKTCFSNSRWWLKTYKHYPCCCLGNGKNSSSTQVEPWP
jgi:hypothetical protein